MTIPRDAIIAALRGRLEADERVLAVWLEGADATGTVDAFSDIDLCCSVSPGQVGPVAALARAALESLGPLDLAQNADSQEDAQTCCYHLAGTSPYLLIDLSVYAGRGSQFVAGDAIEKPLVLFDRAGVIRFSPPAERLAALDPAGRLRALEATAAQHARIEKYVLRGDFLEAFGYYHKWLLMPLIEALRMRYTPLHPDYSIVHISRHLPAPALRRLEGLFQIHSLEELDAKRQEAYAFFQETAAELRAINEWKK